MHAERIVENLNRAHHELFGRDPAVCLIGATVISISVFTWFRVLGYGI